MTIVDLISEFRTLYDIWSLGLPGFEDSEIKQILETTQYRMISQKLGGNNVYGQKYPDTPKRIDDLQGLIVLDTNLSYSNVTNSNTTIITLPSDYLHLIELRHKINGGGYEICKQIDQSVQQRFLSTTRNTDPVLHSHVYVFTNTNSGDRKIRLYYDTSIPVTEPDDTIECLYIKKPKKLTSIDNSDTTPLDDYNEDVYHELVAQAIDRAIEIATPNKVQISQQGLNKNE